MTDDTHRASLRAWLDAYRRAWPDETAVVGRIRALIERRSDCLLRTCFDPGHLTASAWVCTPDAAQCVLLHHAKLDRWLQPGGHADGDPRLAEVARREVHEETGLAAPTPFHWNGALVPLDLDVHVIPARRNEPAHEHHDVRFLLIAAHAAPLVLSEESRAVRWLPVARLAEFTAEESVLRLARKAAQWLGADS